MKIMKRTFLTFLLPLIAVHTLCAQQVIAHRGYWKHEGAAQNSRASLQYALDLNIYGSETDVWLTADEHIMVNHDAAFNGVEIEKASYGQCKNLTLKNGEKMPELKDFLQMMREYQGPTKLIIEIKKHSTPERNREAARQTVAEVRRYGVEAKVEYISFDLDACVAVVRSDPRAKVAYLGWEYTPCRLFSEGCTGVDFEKNVFRRPATRHWLAEAKRLGMTVNVWTVNKPAAMEEMRKLGVDYITTDEPIACMLMLKAAGAPPASAD